MGQRGKKTPGQPKGEKPASMRLRLGRKPQVNGEAEGRGKKTGKRIRGEKFRKRKFCLTLGRGIDRPHNTRNNRSGEEEQNRERSLEKLTTSVSLDGTL